MFATRAPPYVPRPCRFCSSMESHAYPGYGIPPGSMYQGTAPAMFFNHKAEKIDWRRIAAVDLNRIAKELDFTALQDTISNIAFCDIEHELDTRYVDPNYIRLFKLAQLQIQYLLYSQDYLTGSLSSEADKGQAAMDELDKVRRELSALRDRQVELKKQCHRYKKMVRIQQMLMPSSHDLHHPCPHCDKKFISRDFLSNHLERRHQNANVHPAPPVLTLSQSNSLKGILKSKDSPQNSKDVEELREHLKVKSNEIDMLRQQILQGVGGGGGNIDLSGLRHDMMQQHKEEMDALKNMFMDELKDLNSKYMASEKALQELRVKQNQGSRSNLGELEDDDDAVKLQQEQERKLADENRKLKADIAREKAINEKRKIDLDRQRAEFENRIMEARERSQVQKQSQSQSQIHESSVVSDLDDSEITPFTIPQPFVQSGDDENHSANIDCGVKKIDPKTDRGDVRRSSESLTNIEEIQLPGPTIIELDAATEIRNNQTFNVNENSLSLKRNNQTWSEKSSPKRANRIKTKNKTGDVGNSNPEIDKFIKKPLKHSGDDRKMCKSNESLHKQSELCRSAKTSKSSKHRKDAVIVTSTSSSDTSTKSTPTPRGSRDSLPHAPRQHSTPKQRKQMDNESMSSKRRQSDDERKDEDLIERRTAAMAASTGGRKPVPPSQPKTVPTKFMQEDSEDETEDESESILVSKEMKKTLADTGPMGTGELSATSSWDISQLRSSRVMEKLKAEPKLLQGFISELKMILEERLMELGVDKAAKRLTTPVLNEKLAILRKERDQLARKHARFTSIRQQYVREVEKDAQERLRGVAHIPPAPQPTEYENRVRSQSATQSPAVQKKINGPKPPPRPSPQADRRSSSLPIPSSPNENRPQPSAPSLVPALRQRDFDSESEESDESYSAFGDDVKPHSLTNGVQPSAPPASDFDNDVRPSPRKPRQHRPLSASNGIGKLDSPESVNDWDTTDGRKLSMQAGGDIVIPSRTVKKEEEEVESDDWDDDDDDEMEQLEKELAGGANMDYLRQSLEQQMQRPRDSRPVGGISLFPRQVPHEEDDPIADILDDEDDAFDVSSLNGDDSRPPSRKISGSGNERGMFGVRTSVGSSGGAGGQNSSPSGQLRLSNAGTDLSNTFGTSQWGTTSKVVSTVNPGATQKSMATNKSSDVGGDDDFDSD